MMEKKFKIVLINKTFQLRYYYRRWELFAQTYPNVDVTLLTPEKAAWYNNKVYSFGKSVVMKGEEISTKNFHIRTFRQVEMKGVWYSPDFKRLLTEIKPDIVYHLGTHQQYSLVQVGNIVKKYLPAAKLILFSMRGPVMNLENYQSQLSIKRIEPWARYLLSKYVVNYVNKNYDAVFCHYPDAVSCFKKEGYSGPIYMQTQVGVNTEWFHEDNESRKNIRDSYRLGESYVFGAAARFTEDKGLDDIIGALPIEGNWKLLLMGTGHPTDIQRIKDKIHAKHIEERVILTGLIDKMDMPQYWNAIDCAIHVPHTTKNWVETFSLSAIQPMATKKPIIANTSGSVPYQVGPDAIIVEEGNIQQLHDKMSWVLSHQKEAHEMGNVLYHRVMSCFSVEHLNQLFYDTLQDILEGKFDKSKTDMTKYRHEKS